MEYKIGDFVVLKKHHPCGSKLWEIIRVGVDFKFKCKGCDHIIMVERPKALKMIKRKLDIRRIKWLKKVLVEKFLI